MLMIGFDEQLCQKYVDIIKIYRSELLKQPRYVILFMLNHTKEATMVELARNVHLTVEEVEVEVEAITKGGWVERVGQTVRLVKEFPDL